MKDPYQVLNIPSTASDEEVKKAYRELARKYHPDNYHDNPLADLAQEKMKEINEAYAEIQKMRGNRRSSGNGQSAGYSQQSSGGGYTSASGDPVFVRVRMAIQQGDLQGAERLLGMIPTRNGEWYFLKGSICYRRGWMDEAHSCFETACSMAPDNLEYRQALERLENSGQAYRPQGFEVFTTGCGSWYPCAGAACACYMCNLCGGGMRYGMW